MSWESQYGRLYYDQYVLENWDYTHPQSEDLTQWKIIAKKWLVLTLKEREPWYKLGPDMGGKPSIPTQAQIERILVPHQTPQERNMGHDPYVVTREIWLRTCYAPDLNNIYEDVFGGIDSPIVEPEYILDDKDSYAFEDKWDCVLNRVPTLCDAYFDEIGFEHFLSDNPPSPSDPTFELWDAALREVVMVYLIDRQALLEKLVTVMWLDCHGECVWWYRIDADDLMDLTGWIAGKGGLMSFLEFADPYTVGEKVLEKGTLIDWLS